MPHREARAWWDDVQHVRETIERRRADAARSSATPNPRPEGRFARPVDLPASDSASADVSLDVRDGDAAATTPGARHDRDDAGAIAGSRRFDRDDADDLAPDARGHREHAGGIALDKLLSRDDVSEITPGRRFERSDHAGHAPADPDRARARGRRAEVREHWSGVDRRDPTRADRRVAGHGDHRAPGHIERRDPARADRRDPARADRRAKRHADHRERRHDPARSARRASARDERPGAPRTVQPGPGAAAGPASASTPRALEPPSRRTVQITGRPLTAPRLVEVERRRPVRRPVERIGGRPDRIALWAVLFCFFLILVAASS